jgi:hypothetical protein
MLYSVKDGVRTLKFDGDLLASSSSRVGNRPRWVEFRLFRTKGGTYVLSRTGMSVLFHASSCSVVERNRLSARDEAELGAAYTGCPDCKPNRFAEEGVFPETPRHWAQASDTPKGILSALMKYDENGTEYLTNVARALLEDASEVDEGIGEVFYTDTIE